MGKKIMSWSHRKENEGLRTSTIERVEQTAQKLQNTHHWGHSGLSKHPSVKAYFVIITPAIVQGGGTKVPLKSGGWIPTIHVFHVFETFIQNNKHLVLNPPINTVSSPKELITEFMGNSLFAGNGVKQIAYKLLHC